MQYKSTFLAVTVGVLGSLPAPASTHVVVLNESGKEIRVVQSMDLSPGHIGVPVDTFELFGLKTSYRATEKRVYIYNPPSSHESPEAGSVPLGFKPGDHQVYSPIRGYLPERHSYPLALNRNGRLYISVSVVQKLFPRFTCGWEQKSRTLTLKQRSSSVEVW